MSNLRVPRRSYILEEKDALLNKLRCCLWAEEEAEERGEYNVFTEVRRGFVEGGEADGD